MIKACTVDVIENTVTGAIRTFVRRRPGIRRVGKGQFRVAGETYGDMYALLNEIQNRGISLRRITPAGTDESPNCVIEVGGSVEEQVMIQLLTR